MLGMITDATATIFTITTIGSMMTRWRVPGVRSLHAGLFRVPKRNEPVEKVGAVRATKTLGRWFDYPARARGWVGVYAFLIINAVPRLIG
jgi:type IV secretory pathway protease TraF